MREQPHTFYFKIYFSKVMFKWKGCVQTSRLLSRDDSFASTGIFPRALYIVNVIISLIDMDNGAQQVCCNTQKPKSCVNVAYMYKDWKYVQYGITITWGNENNSCAWWLAVLLGALNRKNLRGSSAGLLQQGYLIEVGNMSRFYVYSCANRICRVGMGKCLVWDLKIGMIVWYIIIIITIKKYSVILAFFIKLNTYVLYTLL